MRDPARCIVNLSAMHRACGQPPDEDPLSWTRKAAPVISAIHQYKGIQDPSCLKYEPVGVLRLHSDEDLDELDYPGDLETEHKEIAVLYAHHLDGLLPVEPPFEST